MAITSRTRKVLWALAAGLCCRCKRRLVEDETELDDHSVIGEECHIIGEKTDAARGEFGIGRSDLDEYPNLVLMCSVHHKVIDDQVNTNTVESLLAEKAAHERWVADRLRVEPSRQVHPRLRVLTRITTGVTLSGIVGGAEVFISYHDEPANSREAELMSELLGTSHDIGEIWNSVDAGEHVNLSFMLTQALTKVEAGGLIVFALSERGRIGPAHDRIPCRAAVVAVVRESSPAINEQGQLLILSEQ